MRTHVPVIAIAVIALGGLLFACTTTNNNGPGRDAGSPRGEDASTPTADGSATVDGAPGDAGDAAVTPGAYVRIANWSPDAPAVEVCFNEAGASSWTGQVPRFARIVAAGDAETLADAGAAGISFPQVTSYLLITPGSYEVRLVVAGAADCSKPVVDLAMVTLAVSSYATIAALGEATPVGMDPPLSLVPFTDEVSAPPGQIALRFINASPSPTLTPADLGTGSIAGSGGLFAPLFAAVGFGKVAGSDGGTIDVNGYAASTPFATATLSAHPTAAGADTTVALNDVTISATSAATVALVNGVGSGPASGGAKLLQCADADKGAGTSLLSTCSIISTQ
jgi:Domain of unknown function (DUF4397)